MREIVLDTETTGFEPDTGDRIVEIGCVELINHITTGKTFHVYINPMRAMPAEAQAVHGLDDKFLRDKPVFRTIAQDFLDFVQHDPLIIHNAAFDLKFLNFELASNGFEQLNNNHIIDTLLIARRKYPGSQASLDALCRRFNIDTSARTLHGALLDSEILAEVYLELIGGRQPDFMAQTTKDDSGSISINSDTTNQASDNLCTPAKQRPSPLAPFLCKTELAAHKAFIKTLSNPLWNNIS